MPKPKISVCILGLNEQANIKNCLESVKDLADEIVVGVDDQSTDKTLEIAKRYSSKVYLLPHQEMFHHNKQQVVNKATGTWILWLDADEKVSANLVKEIQKAVASAGTTNSFSIPRKNYIFNQWINHAGWYPDYQLRLWKKGKAKWPLKSIHEDPITQGQTAKLKHHLIHNNYTSVSQYLNKLNLYSSLDAQRRRNEFKSPFWKPVIIRPIDEFIKRFLALKGYKQGLHGLAVSLLQSFYELVVVLKVWELSQFRPEEIKLGKAEKEIKAVWQSWRWWKRELKIKNTSFGFIKIWQKILRKLGL